MSDRGKEILSFFQEQRNHKNEQGYVSGEDIAERLGFTRAAVWHHIDTLKKLGYEFEAVPRLGYRLIREPDRLRPDEIETEFAEKLIGRKIYYYDETQSTNDVAEQLARDGAMEGTIVAAEYQNSGRGRLKRKWLSPKGRNLLFSVILRPHLDPGFVSLMTIMSSVALARAMRQEGVPARIKWPNDVYVDGKKIAGILTEMSSEQDRVKYVVIGIGMNVNMSADDFQEEIRPLATSMRLSKGLNLDRMAFFKKVLVELEDCYHKIRQGLHEAILEEWSRYSFLMGQWIEVVSGQRRLEGVVIGTDARGELLLKLENGFVESIISGDINLKNGK
jgi:BirA family biotin operon repressor/biotin-[acetyl-CoA-carboxylase] ligase